MATTYTITAALPYANGPIHIGHLAGVYLPADVYARYQRLRGEEVLFICGSDEGGAAITLRARQEGITPQELVDKYHALNQQALSDFGISFDYFGRTTDALHHATTQDFFRELERKGALEVAEEEQYYDEEAQFFLADRYIRGGCPRCKTPEAYGDQCEACGSTLSPQELLEPRSILSGAAPILKKTRHWYLLQRHQEWLKQWLLTEHKEWKPNVLGQCGSWLTEGLRARAITRDLPWGVPVPLAGADGKVIYVWFEAPIGYISATQAWAEKEGRSWEKFWKDPATKLIQFVGKDNIVFHCLIFPAMLRAHGGYILPTQVPANEFMNLEGQKISTSRDHAVWLHDYLRDYPQRQDVLRYVLLANAPESKDSDFTWADFRARNNNELVAILGNFVHRTLILTHKYFAGKVPGPGHPTPTEELFHHTVATTITQIEAALGSFKFRQALSSFMELARLGNRYLAETTPWLHFAKDPVRVATILHAALQLIARIATLATPFLPHTSQRLHTLLALSPHSWEEVKLPCLLPPTTQLQVPQLLFEKIEETKNPHPIAPGP